MRTTTVPAGLSRQELEIFKKLDPKLLPQHVAIIMDGNGRWARRRHLPRIAGHKVGVESVRSVVTTAARIGIPHLTLYAFSAENWKRPETEVTFLMRLLHEYVKAELPLMMDNNVRMDYIGRIHELPEKVRDRMMETRDKTSRNTGMLLTLALNYGARNEIIDAVQAVVDKAIANHSVTKLKITEQAINEHLYTAHMPDPDLIIRTSGEMRISNFLLWQLAYAEIYVTEKLWPDFRGTNFLEAILDFQKRERRYGGLGASHAHVNGTNGKH